MKGKRSLFIHMGTILGEGISNGKRIGERRAEEKRGEEKAREGKKGFRG